MYILYKTINKITKQIYIGVHRQTIIPPQEFDGYLGSGDWKDEIGKNNSKMVHPEKMSLKEAIGIYGRENFERKTLFYSEDMELVYDKERQVVNEKFISSSKTYNLILGGKIPPNHTALMWITDGTLEKRICKDSIIPDNYRKGRLPMRQSVKDKLRLKSLQNGNIPPRHDKNSGYWNDTRLQAFKKLNINKKKKPKSLEHRKKFSELMKGENNPCFGTTYMWITDGVIQKRWPKNEQIPENFKLGTTQKGHATGKHKLLVCPYCGKSGGQSALKRWHFDKCANKINEENR